MIDCPHRLSYVVPMSTSSSLTRCAWAGTDPLSLAYHDREWGVPLHNDRKLFEMLILEGAQAGLSWITILRKRDHYRTAFDRFDPQAIARYDAPRIRKLLHNDGIVRNKLKICAAVENARAFLAVRERYCSFETYIWQFIGGSSRQNRWKTIREIPARTPESDAMSKDLKAHGFRFVGPTICYAFMQAVGMVNDHLVTCHRHQAVQALGRA